MSRLQKLLPPPMRRPPKPGHANGTADGAVGFKNGDEPGEDGTGRPSRSPITDDPGKRLASGAKDAPADLVGWVDERMGATSFLTAMLMRKVPKGTNWFYTLGSATLFAFVVQAVTGVFLAMYYTPSPVEAYASITHLTNDVFLGEFVRGMLRSSTKGPQVIVSRRSDQLVRELFKLEVPEMADGLVEIKGVAREPGWRSKIAVISHVQGVDPVGACVGPRGSRVRMVVSELRGEKIDIIPYNDEPARYVAKALSPARVREVLVDDENRQATVIVPDDQLSLSIGREGMNARLAARLTGWHIDIKSESTFAREEESDEFGDETEAGVSRCAAILRTGKRCPNAASPARATAPFRRTRASPRSRPPSGGPSPPKSSRRPALRRAGSASPSSPPSGRARRRTVRRRRPRGRGHDATRAPRPRAALPRLRRPAGQARAGAVHRRAGWGRPPPGPRRCGPARGAGAVRVPAGRVLRTRRRASRLPAGRARRR